MRLIESDKVKQIEKVKKILDNISNLNYESVFVVAIKNNQWEVYQSAHASVFKTLGMLEIIKETILEWFREKN